MVVLAGAAPLGAADRPNVLFISLDDMNDWLGCYGGHPDAITPNIDKLAARGVRFTNAHCVSPICGPSRASVLTGLRPETSGVYHNKGKYIDYVPDAVTFPEHFRANGYLALAAGKVNHDLGDPDPRLWNENGPDCGVLGTPFIDDELHTAMMTPSREINRGSIKITLPANGGLSAIDRPNNTWDSFDWAPMDCPETDFPDRRIADWGVEQLAKEHDKPMLLALGFYKPHQPFFAPRKYFDLYDVEKVRLPDTIAGDLYDVPAPGRELATQPWTSGTHKTVAEHGAWQEATRAYLATVSFADALVGRVIKALDEGPHADNTWIILWSDHGWSLGEKEHWGKHVPWREGVRMPLMVVPPKNGAPEGFEPGAVCEARVSLLDLYPTLIDACGLPDRDEIEGRSLVPLVEDVEAKWSDAVVATIGRGTHSVSNGDWRYIRYFDGSEELYDLNRDPREWINLASKPEHADLKQELAKHIPRDDRFRQFVRWGQWKCVFPVEGDPMLFDYQGDFGISEQTDLAADNPEVLAQIQEYLESNKITARRVQMPSNEKPGRFAVEATAEFLKISHASVADVPVGTILERLGARMEAGVSADELEGYDRHFGFTDRDGDGRHSKTEYIENGNYLNPGARRGIFNASDNDKDGFVTKAEYVLNRIITDEAKSIVQAMDDDGNGVVAEAEFVRHVAKKLKGEKLAAAVFESLDTNEDGEIIVPEYLRVWGMWARVGRKNPEERLADSGKVQADCPNLIFIVVDDAGYDDFGFTGCTDWQTPRIDSIAANGVTFTDGYVTASVCGPSRAGLITGRYQQSFGHEENLTGGLATPVPPEQFGLPLGVPTLGNLLQEKGYATAAFGKWHLGEHEHFHPNRRGFDHFVGFLGGHRSFWPLQDKAHPGHRLMINDEVVQTPEYLTDHLGREAARFVKANADKPFFLYLAYNAVHSPLQATDKDLATLESISDAKRRVLGAMTIALDRSVGYLLDSLKEHGLEEDTVVVFTNDNGAATYLKTNNGGLRGRKGTVWEGGLRVPFCMSWPGRIEAGQRSGVPVNTLDVGYTFCRLAGHGAESLKQRELDGEDLIEFAQGEGEGRALFWRRGNTSAIREGDWKLITTNHQPAYLFDVKSDPMETDNLIDSKSARARQLQTALMEWDDSLPEPLWRKKASDSYDQYLHNYWEQN